MTAPQPAALLHHGSASTRWVVRIFVLSAFFLTVWLCGPRAAEVLAARFERTAQNSPLVALDRVGFAGRPEWVDQPLLLAMAAEVGPWLQDEVPILDENSSRKLLDGLRTTPWVRDASLERVFPDRFRLHLELRRPVLAVRNGDGEPLCLVDRHGVALPWVDTPLPVTRLLRQGGATTMTFQAGQVVDEARVRAAAAIAVEWRDELAPLVPSCPRLLEVDATNLGERWMRGPGYPEVRVILQRNDGAGVVFAYDHPVDSLMQRVPVRTKATVLGKVLGVYPGLDGLIAADLRMANRWEDYIQPRRPGVPDPVGPWNELGGTRRPTEPR